MKSTIKSPSGIFIIIGFESIDVTQESVNSLEEYIPKGYDILLFDNGSGIPLESRIKTSRAKVTRSQKNLGFAKGSNWIVSRNYQNYDFLCLLNNDVFVNQSFKSYLDSEISEFFSNSRQALFTPILYKDDKLKIIENMGMQYFRSGLAKQNRITNKNAVFMNGACLFIKSEIIRQCLRLDGYLFNPFFEFNAEDLELSLRLISRGYSLRVSEKLTGQHLQSQSLKNISNKSLMLYWRNLKLIFWGTRLNKDLISDLPYFLFGEVLIFGLSIYRGKAIVYFKAWIAFFNSLDIIIEMRDSYKKLDTSIFRKMLINKIY